MQITRICKSLIIIILKNMIIFLKNTYMFSTKVVHLFGKHVHVFTGSYDRRQEQI